MVLGRTNRYLSSFSKIIFIAKKITKNFPGKYKHKTYEVGAILSKNIIHYSTYKKINNGKKVSA